MSQNVETFDPNTRPNTRLSEPNGLPREHVLPTATSKEEEWEIQEFDGNEEELEEMLKLFVPFEPDME